MKPNTEVVLRATKFVCGENPPICRLCLGPTAKGELNIEDSIKLKRSYIDDTVSVLDMFEELGVSFPLYR